MPEPYVHVAAPVFDALEAGEAGQLDRDDDHHVRRVLRLEAGDALVVSDGAGREAPAALTLDGLRLVDDVRRVPEPLPRLHLLQGLAKARKVDEVIRAATELGASAVTVVAAERSVVQLRGDKATKVRDRWQAIARSAAGQSRRAWLPVLAGPVPTSDVARADGDAGALGLLPHVGAAGGMRTVVDEALAAAPTPVTEVRLAVGPEGGWTDGEVSILGAAGYQPVSLGDSVLRTEHAGLVGLAAAAALVGRMD